jgi:hypothetical protein
MKIIQHETMDGRGLDIHSIAVEFQGQIFNLLIQSNRTTESTLVHTRVADKWRELDRSIQIENVLLEQIKLGNLIELKYRIQ